MYHLGTLIKYENYLTYTFERVEIGTIRKKNILSQTWPTLTRITDCLRSQTKVKFVQNTLNEGAAVLFWPPPRKFDTFSSHVFLSWFYKKWLKRYTLRCIPQISPGKFRPHCVVFDSGRVWRPSPLTAYHLLKKQQRQEALCYVSPPLSGMVRCHYWSKNWLHIYQSNLVDFKSPLLYPRPQAGASHHMA